MRACLVGFLIVIGFLGIATAKRPNIVVILTDDQDLVLGSLAVLPAVTKYITNLGANLTNFFVNTPICCPSRATLLSGKYNHNNRCSSPSANQSFCCMYMNTSFTLNPEWNQKQLGARMSAAGYQTGMFGKYLNNQPETCGSKYNYQVPQGWNRFYGFCDVEYYNATWNVDGTFLKTGSAPEDYSTSIIGNKSLQWISTVYNDSKPFFAYIAPHAPHLPSTPAPWYTNATVPVKAPRTPNYNYSALDHHWLLSSQAILTTTQSNKIDTEHENRLKTLLSVNDIVQALAEYLQSVDELQNTILMYTSDHGYSLGQFRIPSHKTQIYDHNTRVPFLISGPGISAETVVPQLLTFADVAPTILELAGYTGDVTDMDGKSFASMLSGTRPNNWRNTTIIEYSSIRQGSDVVVTDSHVCDCSNNSYIALRIHNSTTNLLYAEVVQLEDWQFENPYYYELFDTAVDPWQMTNLYNTVSLSLRNELHQTLRALFTCRGSGTSSSACR